MINTEDAYGRVIRSAWVCREFYSLQDYEAYLAGNKSAYYRNTTYSYEGNLFDYFESRNRQKDYVPAEGKNYSMLEFVGADEQKKLKPEHQLVYGMMRPIKPKPNSVKAQGVKANAA